ncbi:TPA: restriction endonuclease, partial [Streptococcus agalactiae]|nr:restriction endonuclease [Streptococcus agalactiae]
SDYKKRQPNYDTGRMNLFGMKVFQYVSRQDYINEDFFVYDSAFINQTEQQLVARIKERIAVLTEKYSEVYLVRMDENMHRESVKSDKLKLHQFDRDTNDIHFEAFQPDFILLLANSDYYLQIFIEPKGIKLLESEQWKEDLLMYINDHESDLVFEEEVDGVKIKGLKFYTINDGRGAIEQLGEIALGEKFSGLSL